MKIICYACHIEFEDHGHRTYPDSDCQHCLAFSKESVQVCQDCWEGEIK